MDFKLKPREVVTPTLILKLEIELNNSLYTPEEAAERLSFILNSSYCKPFSEFIVFLLRETQSSTWEMKSIEINKSE